MMHMVTDEEIKDQNERLSYLHTSPYVVDNLTAYLMDTKFGEIGLYEDTARKKAHSILGYLNVILDIKISKKRPQ